MSKRKRLIVAIFFVLGFLMAAPPLVWYASGYRFDFNRRQWFTPGWIILDSVPGNATIYINGRDTGKATPATIKNLTADDYIIEVKKDGYHPWQKKLNVQSGKATLAKEIRLFKKGEAELMTENWSGWAASPNGQNLFLYNPVKDRRPTQGLSLININDGKITEFTDVTRPVKEIIWSRSGLTALIFFNDGTKSLYSEKQEKLTAVSFNAIGRSWQLIGAMELWGLDGNKIVSVNLSSGAAETIAEVPGIIQYFFSADKIYVVFQSGKGKTKNYYLGVIADQGAKIISPVPAAKQYQFISGSNLIGIVGDDQKLIVVRPTDDNFFTAPELSTVGQRPIWDKNGKKLLYVTPNDQKPSELWYWNAISKEPELFTRLSDPIIVGRWHPKAGQIFYATQQNIGKGNLLKINALELDSRDKRNVAVLIEKMFSADNSGFLDFYVDSDGISIFWLFREAGVLKLFKQNL